MKLKKIGIALIAVFILSAGGCGKQESEPAAPGEAAKVSESTGTAVTEQIQAAAQETAQKTEQVAKQVAAEVSQQSEAVVAKAQSLIDKTKSLISDKKYQEALDTLKQLSTFKLTPEQQKVVDDLKAQVQKLIADTGVPKAVGNLLK